MAEIDYGQPPRSGSAKLVCELYVDDIEKSRAFWQNLLGFEVAYQRPEEGFAYLERHDGAQIMFCQRRGDYEAELTEGPFGRGVLLQVYINDLDDVIARLAAAAWPLHMELREAWRRWGDREGGKKEILVQDPDGYLVMLAEDLGERPLAQKPYPTRKV